MASASITADVVPSRTSRAWLLIALLLLVCGSLFAMLHFPEVFNGASGARESCASGQPSACNPGFIVRMLGPLSLYLLLYLPLALPGVVLALMGRKSVFAVPFFIPLLLFWNDWDLRWVVGLDLTAGFWDRHPHPTPWIENMPWNSIHVLALTLAAVLVLLPAFVVSRRRDAVVAGDQREAHGLAGIALGVVFVYLLLPLLATIGTDILFPWIVVMVFLFGLILRHAKPWWPWIHAAIPVLLFLAPIPWFITRGEGPFGTILVLVWELFPLFLLGLVASEWTRVDRWTRAKGLSTSRSVGLIAGCAALWILQANPLLTTIPESILVIVLGSLAVPLGRADQSDVGHWFGRLSFYIGMCAIGLGALFLVVGIASLV